MTGMAHTECILDNLGHEKTVILRFLTSHGPFASFDRKVSDVSLYYCPADKTDNYVGMRHAKIEALFL